MRMFQDIDNCKAKRREFKTFVFIATINKIATKL